MKQLGEVAFIFLVILVLVLIMVLEGYMKKRNVRRRLLEDEYIRYIGENELLDITLEALDNIDACSYYDCMDYLSIVSTAIMGKIFVTIEYLIRDDDALSKRDISYLHTFTLDDYNTYSDTNVINTIIANYTTEMSSKIKRMEEEDLYAQRLNESYDNGEPIEEVADYNGEFDKSEYEIGRESFIPHKPTEEELSTIEEVIEDDKPSSTIHLDNNVDTDMPELDNMFKGLKLYDPVGKIER